MSSTTDEHETCANCGKDENSGDLKACTACKMVKYCNRDCQIAHRSQHKKTCRKRAKEIHDEELFKLPPPKEDCPICFLPLPALNSGKRYNSCCGKIICIGCTFADAKRKGNIEEKCPFCRTPAARSGEEMNKRLERRIEGDDANAYYQLGLCYRNGMYGLPQNWDKTLKLCIRAGELGCAEAYQSVGIAYHGGAGVEQDDKKGLHYTELAAKGGNFMARYQLSVIEGRSRNHDRAIKHLMTAVESAGHEESLNDIKTLFRGGFVTKDDYSKSLRAYQTYIGEIRSPQRDEAAAYSDIYKYY